MKIKQSNPIFLDFSRYFKSASYQRTTLSSGLLLIDPEALPSTLIL